MNLLLDTNVFLWWLEGNESISSDARTAIEEAHGTTFISSVVIWEIAIKQRTGKLQAPPDLLSYVDGDRFRPLSISLEHAQAAGSLPLLHRDPFDRMLVAQSQAEGLTLVTRDSRIVQYNVQTLIA